MCIYIYIYIYIHDKILFLYYIHSKRGGEGGMSSEKGKEKRILPVAYICCFHDCQHEGERTQRGVSLRVSNLFLFNAAKDTCILASVRIVAQS